MVPVPVTHVAAETELLAAHPVAADEVEVGRRTGRVGGEGAACCAGHRPGDLDPPVSLIYSTLSIIILYYNEYNNIMGKV